MLDLKTALEKAREAFPMYRWIHAVNISDGRVRCTAREGAKTVASVIVDAEGEVGLCLMHD